MYLISEHHCSNPYALKYLSQDRHECSFFYRKKEERIFFPKWDKFFKLIYTLASFWMLSAIFSSILMSFLKEEGEGTRTRSQCTTWTTFSWLGSHEYSWWKKWNTKTYLQLSTEAEWMNEWKEENEEEGKWFFFSLSHSGLYFSNFFTLFTSL